LVSGRKCLARANAKAILDDHLTELILPIITLCEAVHVINKGRTKIKALGEFLDKVRMDPRFHIEPLTEDILRTSLPLPISEMHDRLIVATALYEQDWAIKFRWSPKTETSCPLVWFPQSGKKHVRA